MRQKLSISRIRGSNALWITDQQDIANEAVYAFQKHLNGDPVECDENLLEHLPTTIDDEQRNALEAPPNLGGNL